METSKIKEILGEEVFELVNKQIIKSHGVGIADLTDKERSNLIPNIIKENIDFDKDYDIAKLGYYHKRADIYEDMRTVLKLELSGELYELLNNSTCTNYRLSLFELGDEVVELAIRKLLLRIARNNSEKDILQLRLLHEDLASRFQGE